MASALAEGSAAYAVGLDIRRPNLLVYSDHHGSRGVWHNHTTTAMEIDASEVILRQVGTHGKSG